MQRNAYFSKQFLPYSAEARDMSNLVRLGLGLAFCKSWTRRFLPNHAWWSMFVAVLIQIKVVEYDLQLRKWCSNGRSDKQLQSYDI